MPNTASNSSSVESQVHEISDNVMSPFCPGRTLSACPSDQARQLREQIGQWITQGYSKEGVENQLQMIYGDDIRGTPDDSALGLLGWTFPVLIVMLGLFLVLRVLRGDVQKSQSNSGEE